MIIKYHSALNNLFEEQREIQYFELWKSVLNVTLCDGTVRDKGNG